MDTKCGDKKRQYRRKSSAGFHVCIRKKGHGGIHKCSCGIYWKIDKKKKASLSIQ